MSSRVGKRGAAGRQKRIGIWKLTGFAHHGMSLDGSMWNRYAPSAMAERLKAEG
jgi:hypothetical protein